MMHHRRRQRAASLVQVRVRTREVPRVARVHPRVHHLFVRLVSQMKMKNAELQLPVRILSGGCADTPPYVGNSGFSNITFGESICGTTSVWVESGFLFYDVDNYYFNMSTDTTVSVRLTTDFLADLNLYRLGDVDPCGDSTLVTGGINVDDPAIDLAVVAAILSSNDDEALAKNVCFAGEVGLSGEIRPVQRVDQRILEAEKLGFEIIFVSKHNKIGLKNTSIKVQLLTKIEDLVAILG